MSTFLLFISTFALLASAMMLPTCGFLVWIAFVPFLIVLKKSAPLKSFFAGSLLGLAVLAVFLSWILRYETWIFFAAVLLAAPFFGLFALLLSLLNRRFSCSFVELLGPPVCWSAVSFLYGFTPLEILGDQFSIFAAPRLAGVTAAFGIPGVTFLILCVNSLLSFAAARKRISSCFLCFAFAALLILLLPPPHTSSVQKELSAALIQHNFPISGLWRLEHESEVLKSYESAVREAGPQVDLVVFPQYGLGVDVLRKPEWLSNLAKETGAYILLGTYLPVEPGGSLAEGARTNSAVLFSPDGGVSEYQAVTAPPFRNIGEALGEKRKPLTVKNLKAGVMLCYEDVSPSEGRVWARQDADFLIALSNPGHFLGTRLPDYHLAHDRIRALETGRTVLRVSPNGFSAVIDPDGTILANTRLNQKDRIVAAVKIEKRDTLFAKTGSLIPFVSFVLFMMGWFVPSHAKK